MNEERTKPARDIQPGDIVFHNDYPADVIENVSVFGGELRLIIWGPDAGDRCLVEAGAPVCVWEPLNV